MKLLFAHDHTFYKYNNEFYSNGSFSKEVLERYTKVFDEVVVISRQKEINEYKSNLTLASADRVSFIEIPNFKTIKSFNKKISAKKIIEKEVGSCDALIARMPSSIGGLAIDYARKKNKKYLIELVACSWDSLWNHSLKGKIVAPFVTYNTKKHLYYSEYSVYVTNEFLQKRYPTKGESVNCSNVSLNKFDDDVIEKRIERINNSNFSKLIIGTVGAINVKHKGQQYIIEALGKLKSEGIKKFEYHLVGGGDNSYLKSIAEKYNVVDEVKFIGSLPHSKVFEWLETIDVYAQPSRQEGLPRALIEAMSRGLPALGAETGGIPELLEKDFIFSNTSNNIEEISKILMNFKKENMRNKAKRNYEESKLYSKDIIEKRRNEFLIDFSESAGKNK